MSLDSNIVGVLLGIRFARSFRISDISGDIIDNVLYSSKSPFGIKYFQNIQETTRREKILFNPDTSDYLRLNTDDLILGIDINNDYTAKIDWLKNEVLKYYTEILFKDFGIKNIKRIGIVFYHRLPNNKPLKQIITTLTGDSSTDSDSINISFSKKLPASEALFRKNVNDYKNIIYNFNEADDALFSSFDYQYYYDPIVEDIRDCKLDNVISDAKSYLENKFYPWLKNYEPEKDK